MYRIIYLPTAQIVRWNSGNDNSRHAYFIDKMNALDFLINENCYLIDKFAEIPFFLEDGQKWKHQYLNANKDGFIRTVPKHLLDVMEIDE